MSKYNKTIKGVTVDVYDIIVAYKITCPAQQHAIKKLLMPGQRGAKDTAQDLREAIQSIERSIQLATWEPEKESKVEADDEGWIVWNGAGVCPLPADTRIEVKTLYGTSIGEAARYIWAENLKYRVIK